MGRWNAGQVENMVAIFADTLFDQPIGDWDTGKVVYMNYMFYRSVFRNHDISRWNTENVQEHMSYQFSLFTVLSGYWEVECR